MSSYKLYHFFSLLLIALVLSGCGEDAKTKEENAEKSTQTNDYTALGPILELQPGIADSLRDWKTYWELQQEMENFRLKNSGDLSYVADELLRIQRDLIHDSIPEKVQNPAVKSRTLVFRTFALKLKDQVKQGAPTAEIDTTRVKLMEAYNAFRYQIADALRKKVYEDFLEQDSTFVDSLTTR